MIKQHIYHFFFNLFLSERKTNGLWGSNALLFYDDNTDVFAASMLISYYSFSSLILSSIIMTSFLYYF